jgi:DNA-binding MarR family transcriptional regulator
LTCLTTGTVTGIIDRLEKGGYVRRERDPRDRRRVIVQPLLERQHRIGPLFATLARAMDEPCSRSTGDELALILDIATRANTIVLEETARLREETD